MNININPLLLLDVMVPLRYLTAIFKTIEILKIVFYYKTSKMGSYAHEHRLSDIISVQAFLCVPLETISVNSSGLSWLSSYILPDDLTLNVVLIFKESGFQMILTKLLPQSHFRFRISNNIILGSILTHNRKGDINKLHPKSVLDKLFSLSVPRLCPE